jgi:diguanylate cyclase (GGDEF)-like protein/PAS domain S-box-containing protein
VLSVLLALATSLPVLADAPTDDPIRVGVYDNPPKVVIPPDGTPTGFWPELVRVIAGREGWDIQWIKGSWREGLARLENGRIDVMVDTAINNRRRERFAFGDETVHVSWSRVYSAPGTRIETMRALDGLRIGALEGSVNLSGSDGLNDLLARFGMQAEIVALPGYRTVLEALEDGRIDAGVMNRDVGNRLAPEFDVNPTPIVFQPADLRFAFPPDSKRAAILTAAFDRQLAALKADRASPYYSLLDQWLGSPANAPAEPTLPPWARQLVIGLLALVAIAAIGLVLVELRVRARTRALRAHEAELEHHKNMLADAQQLAAIGSWRRQADASRTEWSPQLWRLLGADPDRVTPSDNALLDFVYPDDRDRVRNARTDSAEREATRVIDYRIVRTDGAIRHVHERIGMNRDVNGDVHVINGTIQDITERRELDESIRQYQRLIETSTDLFAIVDADYRYTFCNRAYAALYERQPEEVIGRHVWEMVGEDFFETEVRPYTDRCLAGQAQNIEVDRSYPHLGQRRLLIRTYPIPSPDGGTFRAASILTDITDLRATEKQLRASRDRIEAELQTRQKLINALPAHIALLDAEGNILDVNQQWRHFGAENAGTDPCFGVGRNYLDICNAATGDCSDQADVVSERLREVLTGIRETFALEYPCHAPDRQRWFRVMANRLGIADTEGDSSGAVVMHVDITERKLAEQELNRLAYEDPLTGLRSRHGFTHDLRSVLVEHTWQPRAAVVLFDIEQLRDINDAHGYDTGDQLLIEIARRTREAVGDEAVASRIGGDEFAVFLPSNGHPRGPWSRESIAGIFTRPFPLGEHTIEVSAKFGYTTLGSSPRAVEELLREAELALFQYRHADTPEEWVAYTQALDKATRERISITRELRRALSNDEFELHFHPKVRLESGALVACEALIRWNHPERGLQSPATFIPIAEQSQLIGPIGDWAVREACRLLRAWRDEGLDVVRVAVNVSVVQFSVGDFVNTVRDALDAHDVEPSRLTLEITESVFERESDLLQAQLRALHDMGVQLSLDDFGTGYSSLLYLQRYPFDEIKIDQGFVRWMLDDEYSRRIVQTVLGVAGALGAEIVAEGVENEAVRDALIAMGCRIGQGFHYSMPLEAEDFRWLLARRSPLPLESGTEA